MNNIGRPAATLHELGLTDSAILVFTSDHGGMLDSHAEEQKQRPWDESIRVPFLVRRPAGLKPAATSLTAPVGDAGDHADAAVLSGIPIPTTVEGVVSLGLAARRAARR